MTMGAMIRAQEDEESTLGSNPAAAGSNSSASSNSGASSNPGAGSSPGAGSNLGGGGDTRLTKIFVGGLAWETQHETMRRHFEQYGEISEAVVITDKITGRSKGYGFVTFREPEAAKKACVDATPVIDGRRANCNLAYLGAHRSRPPFPFPGNPIRFAAPFPVSPSYIGTPAFPLPNQYALPYQTYGYAPIYSQEYTSYQQPNVYNGFGPPPYTQGPSSNMYQYCVPHQLSTPTHTYAGGYLPIPAYLPSSSTGIAYNNVSTAAPTATPSQPFPASQLFVIPTPPAPQVDLNLKLT